jgi:hypothetical protein
MGYQDTSQPKTRSEKKGKDKKKDKSGNFIYSTKHIRLIEARQQSIK